MRHVLEELEDMKALQSTVPHSDWPAFGNDRHGS